MSDETRWILLEGIYEDVRGYARIEFAALSRKVIHRMQRVEASAIFGDGYIYKTLWDEYCPEVQEGPHDLLERAWDETVPLIDPCGAAMSSRSATQTPAASHKAIDPPALPSPSDVTRSDIRG